MGSLGGVRSDEDGGDVDGAAGADLGVLLTCVFVALGFGVDCAVAAGAAVLVGGGLGFGAPKNAASVVCFVLALDQHGHREKTYAFLTSAAALTMVNGGRAGERVGERCTEDG